MLMVMLSDMMVGDDEISNEQVVELVVIVNGRRRMEEYILVGWVKGKSM